eukprot:scaffold69961_cov31-Phaeocystis_antarctica.AAC.1
MGSLHHHTGLQPLSRRVAASITWGCSLSHMGSQARLVASLHHHTGLQPLSHRARLVAPLHGASAARAVEIAAPSVEQ